MKKSHRVRYGIGGVLVLLLAGGVLSDGFFGGQSTTGSSQNAPAPRSATAAKAAALGLPSSAVSALGGAHPGAEDLYAASGNPNLQLSPVAVEEVLAALGAETPTAGEELDPGAGPFDVATLGGGGFGLGGGAGVPGGLGGGGGGGSGGGGVGGGKPTDKPEGCVLDCKTTPSEPPIVIGELPPTLQPNPPPQFLPPEGEDPRYAPPTFGPEDPDGPKWNPTGPRGPGPVPEPSTWAMLILGFFGLGAMIRRATRGALTRA